MRGSESRGGSLGVLSLQVWPLHLSWTPGAALPLPLLSPPQKHSVWEEQFLFASWGLYLLISQLRRAFETVTPNRLAFKKAGVAVPGGLGSLIPPSTSEGTYGPSYTLSSSHMH